MKLNIPFLNRQRYILLTAYTAVAHLADKAPIVISKKAVPAFPPIARTATGFQSCYGFVGGLKRSATMFTPCDIDVRSDGETYDYQWPLQDTFTVTEHDDPQLRHKNTFITKLHMPFSVECNKKDQVFVSGNHILNDSEMIIPTGTLNFDCMSSVNVFNLIPRKKLHYFVPFRKPMVSIFPLSDLPFHVETEFNPQKYEELRVSTNHICKFQNSQMHKLNMPDLK